LVEGLAKRFRLSILARRIESGVEISQEVATSINVLRGPSSRLRFALTALRFLWHRTQGFDFVLVQGYGLAALAVNLMRFVSRTPTAMLVCSPTEEYYRLRKRHPQVGKPFRARELWGLKTLALINGLIGNRYVVLSHYLGGVVRSHGFRGRIDELPLYGVDTSHFCHSLRPRAELKAQLGLPAVGSVIFFSSRIAPEKDSETLLAAMRKLRDNGRDVWLLHRSGGFEQFRREAAQFGIGDRVIATDAVHPFLELPQSYQASDICVQASRAEGLGFSPLEALACGVPVIATATGGLSETIVSGETGWTYKIGDVEGLTHCLEEALDNPKEAERRTIAGRAMVQARFEQNAVFDQFASLVQRSIESADRLTSERHSYGKETAASHIKGH